MEQRDPVFDSTNVFLFFIRWWKHLAILCLLAAIGGAVFSSPFFIKPKFQSVVILFPTASSSLSRSVILGTQDFLEYGQVEDAERLLQVFESANIRERVTERFDLMNHYEIPADANFRNSILREKYHGNISFRRTQFGAVEVRVRDTDPGMAAAIANEIAALVDTVLNEIRHQRAELAYEVARKQYLETLLRVQEVEDSLKRIMKRGVYDIEGQVSMLTRQLAVDLSENNVQGIRAIEDRLQALGEYGGAYMYHANYLTATSGTLIAMQRRYQEALADLENFVPFQFTLDRAYEAERKVYPVRWLIVFLATFGAGLAGVALLMVYENLLHKGIIRKKN
jgi:uncharacterized protein involved in exopolysaccharide biosynthesis